MAKDMNVLPVTAEAFLAWKRDPVTRVFLAYLISQRLDLAEKWADGQTMSAGDQAYATALGDVSRVTYEEMEKHEQSKRDHAAGE